ncbi:MAG: PKD domain-containing protein, partial [Bacteroidetes bacterium]
MTYQIVYDPNNSFFIYRCAVVLANIQDPTHNTADRRPRFTFEIKDHVTGNPIDTVCGFYDLWPGDGITTWNQTGAPLNFYWKDWSTIGIDFNALSGVTAGQLLDVVFTVHGCAFTAHTGYAYISAFCGSMTIQVAGCEGSGSVTLTGPPGFTQYEWQGPYCPTCPANPPIYYGNPITITTAQGAVTGNIFMLTVTALNGCQVQNVQQIIAFTNVIAAFTHGSACAGQGMQFNDQSTCSQNQITNWDWDFGDATPIQHVKNPVHIYAAANTYTVSLIAYSSDGCSDTTTGQVTVDPLPTPSFTTGESSVCPNIPGKVYTTQAGKLNYIWTIPPQATVTAGGTTTDNSVTLTWNTVGSYSISVNYTEPITLCTAVSATPFAVTVNPLPVPAIGGPLAACAGSTGNIYTTLTGMTDYQWNVSAGGTITSGGSITDNTVTVTWNTPGPQTVSLNYTDANTCTALAPTVYPVTVNVLPIPVISGAAGMCLNTTGTYTTAPGMTGYLWTVSAGGTIVSGLGTNSVDINWTSNGLKTITVNYTDANGCTAVTPSTYDVTVNTLPIPSLNGLSNICTGLTTTYTSDIGMNNYSWTVSAGGTITAGGGPTDASVTVLWSTVGAQSVSVNYVNGTVCTANAPTVLDVTVHALPAPAISGTTILCAGTSGVVYSSQPGMMNYLWDVSAGGSITAGGGTTNSTVTVTWNTPGAQTVSVNFNDANGCTALTPTVYPVTVNPLPVPSIAGPASVCLNSTSTYLTDTGMTNYLWSVSAGGSITSGAGTNSIDILWSTTGVKTITVNYNDANGCIAAVPSTYSVTVSTLPVPALNGLNTICSGNSTTYTTDAGMNNYLWLVSAGGTIIAGGSTTDNSVTVTWNTAGIQ